jgi:hypothetical protein
LILAFTGHSMSAAVLPLPVTAAVVAWLVAVNLFG